MKPIPSIGRIVHLDYNGIHYAAIITRVWTDSCVNLYAFDNADGLLSQVIFTSINWGSGHYTWHWPEQV